MAKIFNLNRIKSILEYNLRWARVKGFEYIDNKYPPAEPGTTGLKPDSSLDSWNVNSTFIPSPPTYILKDNNVNLRDAIAQTIYDVLSGADSTDSSSPSQETLYIEPTVGSDLKNGTGYYIEVPTDKTITLKVGDVVLLMDSTGINVTNTPPVE